MDPGNQRSLFVKVVERAQECDLNAVLECRGPRLSMRYTFKRGLRFFVSLLGRSHQAAYSEQNFEIRSATTSACEM